MDGLSIHLRTKQADVETKIGKGTYVKLHDRYYYYHK